MNDHRQRDPTTGVHFNHSLQKVEHHSYFESSMQAEYRINALSTNVIHTPRPANAPFYPDTSSHRECEMVQHAHGRYVSRNQAYPLPIMRALVTHVRIQVQPQKSSPTYTQRDLTRHTNRPEHRRTHWITKGRAHGLNVGITAATLYLTGHPSLFQLFGSLLRHPDVGGSDQNRPTVLVHPLDLLQHGRVGTHAVAEHDVGVIPPRDG